jgi:phosphonate transport system ATP-binding protein
VQPVFELQGVGLRFGALKALDGIELRIARGEKVAVIGPSGAGKSSLLALLNGTLDPSEGTVRVFGEELSRLHGRRRRAVQREIGTIHQHLGLVDALRVVHNVNAGRLGRWSFATACASLVFPHGTREVSEALRRVGLPEKLYERTERLSGGEQQRVAIARVLIQQPKVTLADEPVASLDRENARDVLDLLVGLADGLGGTLVTSLHDVGVARTRFDRVIGLRQGRIAFDGPPEGIPEELLDELYALERQTPGP